MDKYITDSQLALWLIARRFQKKHGHYLSPDQEAHLRRRLDGRKVPAWLQQEVAILRQQMKEETFLKVALFWRDLGWNVIPGDINKTPLVGFSEYTGETPAKVSEHDIRQWAGRWPWATPLLLPASNPACRLIVVDADHRDVIPWVEATFGPTPWITTTGRAEGGAHFVYRLPADAPFINQANGVVGPDGDTGHIEWDYEVDEETGKVTSARKWGRTKVDIKSGLYVVAPGALHRSGLRYEVKDRPGDWETLTLDDLAHLPLFDLDRFETERKAHEARKEIHKTAIEEKARPFREACWAKQKAELKVSRPELTDIEITNLVERLDANGNEEPFIAWCEAHPEDVNLAAWWGLATNLVAALPEVEAHAEFHRISALSSRYKRSEAEATWRRARSGVLVGRSPTGYKRLHHHGYCGPIPEGYASPASFLRAKKPMPEVEGLDLDLLVEDHEVETEKSVEQVPVDPQWKSYLDGYRDKARAKRKAAEEQAIDDVVVGAARAVLKREREKAKERRKTLRKLGLNQRGPKCRQIHQALINTSSGSSTVASHQCRGLSCILCGPHRIERLAAAITMMPILEHGQVAGAPLGQRLVFEGRLRRRSLPRWRNLFREARARKVRVSQEHKEGCIGKLALFGQDDLSGAHAYVVLDPQIGDHVTILSTLPVRLKRDKKPLTAWDTGTPIQTRVDELMDETFSVTTADPVTDSVKVLGKVISSHGLHLDADTIYKKARPSSTVVERPRVASPATARKVLKKMKLPHTTTDDALGDGVVATVEIQVNETTTNLFERMRMLANLERGAVEPPPPTVDQHGKPFRPIGELTEDEEAEALACMEKLLG